MTTSFMMFFKIAIVLSPTKIFWQGYVTNGGGDSHPIFAIYDVTTDTNTENAFPSPLETYDSALAIKTDYWIFTYVVS